MFTDTHCHIHETGYPDAEGAYLRANDAGVTRLICVGTDLSTSSQAIDFAVSHENAWASLGIHPHEAKLVTERELETWRTLITDQDCKVVAIGECGLDYFYSHSPKEDQIRILHAQLSLAREYNLPVIFHVREAFDDFWPIFDQYQGLRGVLHSFTDTREHMQKAIERGLMVGINGIATFTKIDSQKEMYASVPLESIVLETDSPFLTPAPKRGTVNEPAFVTHVAKFLSDLHSVSLEELSAATQRNATTLFLNK